MSSWFYEYDGQRHGPVNSSTLRHLAKHGAIIPSTRIWKDGVEAAAQASQVKNLFSSVSRAVASRETADHETVCDYLKQVLDAVRDDDEARLKASAPPLHAMMLCDSIASVLLDYEVLAIESMPVPPENPNAPASQRTKPLRQLFKAKVSAVLCARPKTPTPVDVIRRTQLGRREQIFLIGCKEFADGEWLFMDAEYL
jgi:hypothetical protein